MANPKNYEFKQQLAALSLLDQLLILSWILRRAGPRRRRWVVVDAYPIVHVIGSGLPAEYAKLIIISFLLACLQIIT